MIISQIINAVCEEGGVSKEELLSSRRFRQLSYKRWAAFILFRDHTSLSLPRIGAVMGGKDHTSVAHGLRRGADTPETMEIVCAVREKLFPSEPHDRARP